MSKRNHLKERLNKKLEAITFETLIVGVDIAKHNQWARGTENESEKNSYPGSVLSIVAEHGGAGGGKGLLSEELWFSEGRIWTGVYTI